MLANLGDFMGRSFGVVVAGALLVYLGLTLIGSKVILGVLWHDEVVT